jgi:hypothetical protein
MLINRLILYGVWLPIFTLLTSPGTAADVLTYHNDAARTGWNNSEGELAPDNVSVSTFGLRANLPVDGKVDAQPLYVSNAQVFSGATSLGTHDLVIVATEHDSVYAFDADSGILYWRTSLLRPGETPSDDRGCGQVAPEIGVTATPVIDRNIGTHGTIYVVAMSKSSGPVHHQRLHTLNLANGQESGSVEIQASYPGTGPHNDGHGHVIFDPGAYKERPGLLLLNGVVYTAWSSHCDRAPYTSWIIGYRAIGLAQVTVLNLDPNGPPNNTFLSDGSGNAFWNSGAGPAADTNGNIFALTANGPFDTTLVSGFPSGGDYGDTFLKLSPGPLHVSDYFTPFDQAAAAANDTDLGSGGAVVLPDMTDANSNTRHLAVGAGKDSNIYLVDRDNMGKFIPGATSNSNIYQELVGALPGGEWATAAYFNGAIYYGPVGGALRRFTFTQARLNPSPAAMTSTRFGYPGVTPSVSSSGNNSGIVWAYENSGNQAVLHAYDAIDLHELYNSNQNPARDQFGVENKFITPTVCNGKVFVGTTNSVGVFGLLRPADKDFDHNGYADLLWENMQTGNFSVWLLRNGVFQSDISVRNASLSWRAAGIGDFLGDGSSGIVVENTATGERQIWIIRNGVYSSTITLPTISTDWHIAGAGDFDGDGQADLVWENTRSGARAIWFLRNGVYSSALSLPTMSTQWRIAGVGDFDGDGEADLVWENTVTGQRAIWFLQNGVYSSALSLPTISTQWRIAGAADFDGDGEADLVWENTSTGARAIWFMKSGVLRSIISLGNVSTQWEIAEH